MLFNSYIFLMAFLPVTWLIYFGLNRFGKYQLATGGLIAASFVFYGYFNWRLCLLLAASILINYMLHCALTGRNLGKIQRRLMLLCGLAFNFGLLIYFKYLDFALENINLLTGSQFTLHNIVLPLGISFYTFQQVSFVVDSYRGEIERCRILEYSLFVSFFPQLVAGPIVLHSEMIPQFADKEKRKINFANMLSGSEYLIIGLAKKVLLADAFGRMCNVQPEGIGSLNSLSAVTVILAYTLEIYFDFSGYCDMAIGIGKLFNIDIPINFRSPYKAVNIAEFWERWHITLTRFLTTYVYIPLGGSRVCRWKIYRNILIVFALSGLWHGADWSLVLWGVMHGIMMVLYRMTKKQTDRLPGWLTWLFTFLFLNITWTFFHTESVVLSLRLFRTVVLGGIGGFAKDIVAAVCEKNFVIMLARYFTSDNMISFLSQIITAFWLLSGVVICVAAPSSHEIVGRDYKKHWYFCLLAVLFFLSVIRLSEVSTFIYFNF